MSAKLRWNVGLPPRGTPGGREPAEPAAVRHHYTVRAAWVPYWHRQHEVRPSWETVWSGEATPAEARRIAERAEPRTPLAIGGTWCARVELVAPNGSVVYRLLGHCSRGLSDPRDLPEVEPVGTYPADPKWIGRAKATPGGTERWGPEGSYPGGGGGDGGGLNPDWAFALGGVGNWQPWFQVRKFIGWGGSVWIPGVILYSLTFEEAKQKVREHLAQPFRVAMKALHTGVAESIIQCSECRLVAGGLGQIGGSRPDLWIESALAPTLVSIGPITRLLHGSRDVVA